MKPNEEQLDIKVPDISISRLLEATILGGIVFILALPLLGDYGMWMFPIGRDVIFKLAVELLWLLFLLYWSLKNWKVIESCKVAKLQNLKSPITLSLLLLWAVMALATIASVQPEFSVWGNIYKNQGLMTWTHYVLFFFLLAGSVKKKRHWNTVVHIAVFIAALVGLVAFWQVFQNGFDSRAASTLNNSNYLASYLVLLLPLTFALFLKNKTLILGSVAAIQFLALIFTQTRGGYLGTAVATVIFALMYTRPKKILATALFVALAWIFFVFTPLGQNFQQKLPNFTDRFLNLQNILSDSGPRIEAWQAGWQGMLTRPLLGYGPENFFVPFDEHYSGSQDNELVYPDLSPWEGWFDKAHNFIFDIGATTGFLGLFAYIAIFGSAIFVLLKKVSSMKYHVLRIGLISALAGYLAQNLLGFDTIVTGVYLMFLLAYATFISSRKTPAKFETFNYKLRVSLFFVILLLLVIFIISFKTHINILKANHELNRGESLAQNVGVEQAFVAFEKGLQHNAFPVNPNLRRRYAVIALAYYDAIEKRCGAGANMTGSDPVILNCEQLFTDSKIRLARALELQKENAITEWPRFTRNYIYAARISHMLGDYENSDLYFKRALELSPSRTSINAEWTRLRDKRQE